MPVINIEQAEYDWVMQKRKVIATPGKLKKFETAAIVMKRIHDYVKEAAI